MIIKAKADENSDLIKVGHDLIGEREEGDNLIFTHAQNVTPAMEQAHFERMHNRDNGFTKDRSMRKIAEIPEMIFFQHPEFYKDDKALKRWLNSPEGMQFRTIDKGV